MSEPTRDMTALDSITADDLRALRPDLVAEIEAGMLRKVADGLGVGDGPARVYGGGAVKTRAEIVCDACGRATCWNGQPFCEDYWSADSCEHFTDRCCPVHGYHVRPHRECEVG